VKNLLSNNKIIIIFLIIALVMVYGLLGSDYVHFKNTEWLYSGNDMSAHQIGWFFFKNDIWRFPIGSNPNFGDGIGNSIVYSDSIPILALIFKLINFLLPENFQYFSFWFFICFYLQAFFSFKLVKYYTHNDLYSFISSLFFLISPIFIYRLGWHSSLAGQWIIILSLYLFLKDRSEDTETPWLMTIILSCLIHFYFTLTILIIYNFKKILFFIQKKYKIKNYLLKILTVHISLLITMYIVGYFEVRAVDTIALGFGVYKLNLLSLIDPVQSVNNLSWSWFLPDIKLTNGEEVEGFNYLGFGTLIMTLTSIIILISNKIKNSNNLIFNKPIKEFIFISFIFLILALSNKIHLGSYSIVEIPLNKYIYGLLSVIRSSGRLFWIVNYFILFLTLIIIFRNFEVKKSYIFILIFLLIQLIDISSGLRNYKEMKILEREKYLLKDKIWNNFSEQFNYVYTTYPVNYAANFGKIAGVLEKNKIKKTNFIKTARIDRGKAAKNRYQLYENLLKKKLDNESLYVIDNLGHLRILKEVYKNENVGFFFRDNLWLMAKNMKKNMEEEDKKYFNKIQAKNIEVGKKINLNFYDKDSIFGFGWTHNLDKLGVWTEGEKSNLIFRTNKKYNKLFVEMDCKAFLPKNKKKLNVDIFINDKFNSEINIQSHTNDDPEKIKFKIKDKFLKTKNLKIDFFIKNPIAPIELMQSPDSRKLGFLLTEFMISES